MWDNREHYNGLSVLPYDGGTYVQAPFEDIKASKYTELMKDLQEIVVSASPMILFASSLSPVFDQHRGQESLETIFKKNQPYVTQKG